MCAQEGEVASKVLLSIFAVKSITVPSACEQGYVITEHHRADVPKYYRQVATLPLPISIVEESADQSETRPVLRCVHEATTHAAIRGFRTPPLAVVRLLVHVHLLSLTTWWTFVVRQGEQCCSGRERGEVPLPVETWRLPAG